MSNIIPIAAFLKRNLKPLKAQGTGRRARELLLMGISWHIGRNHLVAVEDGGKIVGVGIGRGINKEGDERFPYAFNDMGRILFIENVAAKNKEAFKNLLRWARLRWPHAEKIMFHRSKNGSQNKIYNFNEFLTKAHV